MNKQQQQQLKDTMFKLILKYPYNVVRSNVNRIGNQLHEMNNKVVNPN